MESLIGIFRSINAAEQTVDELTRRDMPQNSIVLLSAEAPRSAVQSAPESELNTGKKAAAGDAGKNVGAGLGATLGGAAGFTAGPTAASLMVPGLGVIFAIGIGAAALLGLGGAAVAGKVGDVLDKELDTGVLKEQADFCRQLLRRGYSLVIANVRSGADISTVKDVFREQGSEDAETAKRELGRAA